MGNSLGIIEGRAVGLAVGKADGKFDGACNKNKQEAVADQIT